ncbi:MAG: tRNA 2-thiouridine(34) synthase MnmA [Lachnospiraceae bacterium]|nr:tRNA 2-thiouridine(34) synthase MnmA [Lachnospiraceae bacterium]
MEKVLVGLSGGVDSAVCAYLLKQQGYDVVGVTLRTWLNSETEVSKCCELEDAADIAKKIGIPFHIHNVGSLFCSYVTTPFVSDYIHGLTPSPCVECNRHVKWEGLIYLTHVFNADLVATGHYANIIKLENGRYTVKQSEGSKDQTYMLYRLSQEQLSKTIMPLGNMSKDRVREIASEAGLHVAQKPDSQEICFVADGCYADYVESHAKEYGFDSLLKGEGNFVDEEGNILGRHKGIINYTIGQRKGLGIAFGHPVFVKEIRPETNEVVLSEDEALYTKEVYCNRLNFLSIPGLSTNEEIRANVRIRYRHKGENATLRLTDNDTVLISFENAVRASTPGQSAVFYDEEGCVIGGGVIIKR